MFNLIVYNKDTDKKGEKKGGFNSQEESDAFGKWIYETVNGKPKPKPPVKNN